jgi:hypothetical protein
MFCIILIDSAAHAFVYEAFTTTSYSVIWRHALKLLMQYDYAISTRAHEE